MLKLKGNHYTPLLRHVKEFEEDFFQPYMKKLLWTLFVLVILLVFIGLTSCIESGDADRPGMRVSADLILTKVWEITAFMDDGQNKTDLFNNVFLEFHPNSVFKVTKECEIVKGEWILSSDSTLLVIRLPDSPEPLGQLEDEWVVTWLSDTEMHFIEQDDKGDEEFHLQVAPLQSLSCNSCDYITNILTDSIWSITRLTGGANDATEEVRDSYLQFEPGGKIILHHDNEQLLGSWVVTDHCQTLVIKWSNDQILPSAYNQLENTWYISQNDYLQIAFENETTDARLEITKGRMSDCKELRTSMLNTSWFIHYMIINNDDVSGNFIGTGLTFLENNKLATEVLIGPAVLGEWMLAGACDQLILDIPAGYLSELSRDWVITDIEDEKIVLVHEEGSLRIEMHLKKGEPSSSYACGKLIEFIIQGTWSVRKYSVNGQYENNKFDGYNYQFVDDGDLIARNSDHEIIGSWHPIRDCTYLVLEMDQQSATSEVTGKWKIESFNDNSITMVYDHMSTKRTLELIRN